MHISEKIVKFDLSFHHQHKSWTWCDQKKKHKSWIWWDVWLHKCMWLTYLILFQVAKKEREKSQNIFVWKSTRKLIFFPTIYRLGQEFMQVATYSFLDRNLRFSISTPDAWLRSYFLIFRNSCIVCIVILWL